MKSVFAAIAGIVFGAGLVVSGMSDPARVLAFLTLGPDWDPSLMFVMGSALMVSLAGYRFSLWQQKPWFDGSFHLPTRKDIDGKLLGGACLFGLGWGVAGFCPGPALTGAMNLDGRALVFVLGFMVSAFIFHRWQQRQSVVPA